ncbi:hypothetical protein D9M72_294980 [compost metagenome]
MQSLERIVVGRQHQHVWRHHAPDARQGRLPAGQRVRVRLHRMHRDIGRNARQDLVAGNHHEQIGRVQAGMLRRMALPRDDLPVVGADAKHRAILDAAVAARQARDHSARAAKAVAVAVEGRFVPTGAPAECKAFGRHFLAGFGNGGKAVQVLQARHPEVALEPLHQPAGHANVIGMLVRDDDARHRLAGQRPCQQRFPGIDALRRKHAGIDDRPAIAVLDGPDIDVRQHVGQGQPHPQYAGCDLIGLTGCGCVSTRIVQPRNRLGELLGIWTIHRCTPAVEPASAGWRGQTDSRKNKLARFADMATAVLLCSE